MAIGRWSTSSPRCFTHGLPAVEAACAEAIAHRRERLISLRAGMVPRWNADKLERDALFHDLLVVVAAASNPLIRRRQVTLAELIDLPWVPMLGSFFGPLLAATFRAQGLEPPRTVIATTSYSMRNEPLASGRYLAIVPGFSVRLPHKHALLRALPVDLSRTRMPVAIITLKKRSLSGVAQLFIENLRAFTGPLAKS
jgi:DNA-binding transcriptional LysR family regulator